MNKPIVYGNLSGRCQQGLETNDRAWTQDLLDGQMQRSFYCTGAIAKGNGLACRLSMFWFGLKKPRQAG